MKAPDNFLICTGRSFRAEWYYTQRGEMPAYDHYRALPAADQDRLDNMVRYFCDRPYGIILPKSMYRIEDPGNKIYAFKPRDERYFNFTAEGGAVIITNAYRKHSMKMTKKDLDALALSVQYRGDYLRRVKGETYYGDPGN